MNFQQTTLSNGLTLIAETNPSVHSVAAGLFVRAGSRDETADVSMVKTRLNAEEAPGLGDATGARSEPLAKIAVLHRTSCDQPNFQICGM